MNPERWSLIGNLPTSSGDAEFVAAWRPVGEMIGPRSAVGEMAMLQVMRDAGALQAGSVDPAWGGGWRWDLSKGAAKSVLTSAMIYGMLIAAGVPGLLPLVVPAVIPLLFEVEKVRLARDEHNVIHIIGARSGAFNRYGTRREL